ncbi:MAG TPA: trypsin-like serine protease, partial [Allosphingosinicella sp.]
GRTTTAPSAGTWYDNASLGFAVTYTTSTGATARGYVTAAHFDECKPSSGIVLASCTVNQPATEVASGATLNFVRQNFTTDHDVELRTTSSSAIAPTNVVRYGGGAYAYTSYAITGTGIFSISYPVCKQGQSTFYTCGTVADTAALVSDANSGLYGRFVRIQPNSGTPKMADHGDSGGPVFAGGGLAMGLTTAAFLDPSSPFYNQMVSMPISRLSGVSASVLTVP